MTSDSILEFINFDQFELINKKVKNPLHVLVFALIQFRSTNRILICCREDFSRWLKIGEASLNNTLQALQQMKMIAIVITTDQKGYKRTKITVRNGCPLFVNYKKLEMLRNYTQDDELSLLYGFIAFKINAYDKLNQPGWVKEIDGKIWCKLIQNE